MRKERGTVTSREGRHFYWCKEHNIVRFMLNKVTLARFNFPKFWDIIHAMQLLWNGSSSSILQWLHLYYCFQVCKVRDDANLACGGLGRVARTHLGGLIRWEVNERVGGCGNTCHQESKWRRGKHLGVGWTWGYLVWVGFQGSAGHPSSGGYTDMKLRNSRKVLNISQLEKAPCRFRHHLPWIFTPWLRHLF